MARTSLSSISILFLILLIFAFTFFAQLAPVSADPRMRKLGDVPSPPPSPLRNQTHAPGVRKTLGVLNVPSPPPILTNF
ncbi:hypothetical protein D0Y65_042206 [Glycine soja]|uniref:Transmembrane protein n=1 Tax=Glycine soja TaxID=3848 RepID=A0A0B2SVQ4_GLYSO|nr:hypothetical protein glysoja_031234 [Glycine soja]RZB66519.1 hypothetical protein D0Y65_042206 [Glycine soja]